ncbi:MAG: glycoside hydrolase family 57 protein [Candidatus Geothermarchaeales archaeon]
MKDIVLMFEVHQPFRINKLLDLPANGGRSLSAEQLNDLYFDTALNKEVLERAAAKCYLPSNGVLLDEIERFKDADGGFKVAFSISGTFLEQCVLWKPEVVESFRALANTGRVEFLGQTYHHSLASLFQGDTEFLDQVRLHRKTIRKHFGVDTSFFENTEFLYSNNIARLVEKAGYSGIYTEGIERILGWRSPNYVYRPKGTERMKMLLRNYGLSDDIGFRFSSRWWSEWPLTADKYAAWLNATSGQCISICLDYETFGEHHWPESGIREFLRHLPREVLKHDGMRFSTPSETSERWEAADEIDVPDEAPISWADIERDTGAWLGNEMQRSVFAGLERLGPIVKGQGDVELLDLWRKLQVSDNFYYMFTGSGGPGIVHSYFSPMDSPLGGYIAFSNILLDLSMRTSHMSERGGGTGGKGR